MHGAGLNEDADINVVWDDSLLRDPEAEKMSDLQAVSQGIMTAWEFRVKWYGDTEEEAKKILADERANNSTINDFFNAEPNTGAFGNE